MTGTGTFRKAFEQLNELGHNSLFSFDGERVVPRDIRIKLIFIDACASWDHKLSSSRFSQIPKRELEDSIASNFRGQIPEAFLFTYYDPSITSKKAIRDFAGQFEDTVICVQQSKREDFGRYWISTEELSEFICMLYFRENGYVVQKPLHTYGNEGRERPGVDDVIAWKSPVVSQLRRLGYISNGCHISEIMCLRWLGKSHVPITDAAISDSSEEAILIEAESSLVNAFSNSQQKGVNQLKRASKLGVATKLFIAFPVADSELNQVLSERSASDQGQFGKIIIYPDGIHFQDSDVFPHHNLSDMIREYEQNLRKCLLNNFYFDEILGMIRELGVNIETKGFEEVLADFDERITQMPNEYLLEKLGEIIQ